jgi:hypothetical protein
MTALRIFGEAVAEGAFVAFLAIGLPVMIACRRELVARIRNAWRAFLEVPSATDARRMAKEARRGDLYGGGRR